MVARSIRTEGATFSKIQNVFQHTLSKVVKLIKNSPASAYPKPTKKLKQKTTSKKAFLNSILISFISRLDWLINNSWFSYFNFRTFTWLNKHQYNEQQDDSQKLIHISALKIVAIHLPLDGLRGRGLYGIKEIDLSNKRWFIS